MKRFPMRAFVLVIACLAGLEICRADELAAVTGLVTDPNGRSVPGVTVLITNLSTNVAYKTITNDQGIYRVPSLQPGIYRMTLDKDGFKSIVKSGVELHVQDVASINFELQIGSVNETVTVKAGGLVVNTADASVGTVIDRNFVQRLPLNGRSFNMLLQLTPGVVIGPTSGTGAGQFSIAGQRQDANNFLVDGVSANFGISPNNGFAGATGTGNAQAFSAIGGTSSLVSVDALQEFRIETSSFAPEFGRNSGGQVILNTRSGTNSFHGGAFDYFRNTVMDANDWFAKQMGLPRSPEHHNDFGGFLGGPIQKDKTFFFFSYEGSRLRLPATSSSEVPSNLARASASAAVVPFLNAYPISNGAVSPDGYTALFTGSHSDPATLNATSVRIDHVFNDRFTIFGRYNDAPSDIVSRLGGTLSLSNPTIDTVNSRTITIGLNMLLSNRLANTIRANYSSQNSIASAKLDSFGGAVPPPASTFLGTVPLPPGGAVLQFAPSDAPPYTAGQTPSRTRQANIVDDVSITIGAHQLKFGVDERAIFIDTDLTRNTVALEVGTIQNFVTTGTIAFLVLGSTPPAHLLAQSLSVYGQDTWRLNPRLTLTYGVRWEIAPAPWARGNTSLPAWTNTNDSAKIALAPLGTPLWRTQYGNFAPRFGFAYSLTENGTFVLRAGGGVFYDTGTGGVLNLASDFPNISSSVTPNVSLPITDLTPFLPGPRSRNPPYPSFPFPTGYASNFKLPRSYQWNVALEKSLGGEQAITATFVGQAGRDLSRQEDLFQPNANFAGPFFLTSNDAWSNYEALQVQFRRPVSKRVQALLNYTWSHSLDNASNDVFAQLSNTIISAARDYASSGFDVRHSFSGALTYDVPGVKKFRPLSLLTRDWSVDTVIVARTGFPFNGLVVSESADPAGQVTTRPDRVPGQPLWIGAPNAPGGKILNAGAFLAPTTPRQGTEGRNDIPGFGLTQVDLSVARTFPIREGLNLQFRADAFNVLNHPNFANPFGFVETAFFGTFGLQSQSMLNQAPGVGINPLFQQGGPRSLQLSLKLTF